MKEDTLSIRVAIYNRDGISISERTSAAAKNKDSRCPQGRISP